MNSQEKNNPIPIFYEGQDDLIEILAASMCSVCFNTKSMINFYILDCGISNFNKKQLESLKNKFDNFTLEFIPIDLKRFDGLKGYRAENFVDCYARLLIPELKTELNRAIYLDTDVIALGDIKELWDQNLDGFEIGGVYDIFYGNDKFIKKAHIVSGHKFVNAGVLLIDCKKWRDNKTVDLCFELARTYKDCLGAIIEDLLNAVYNDNRYKLLDFRFGYSELPNNSFALETNSGVEINPSALQNSLLMHFSGLNKPWRRKINPYLNKDLSHFSNFWFYISMTPFFEGMKLKFVSEGMGDVFYAMLNQLKKSETQRKIVTYKLFGLIPVVKVIVRNRNKIFKLFGLITILRQKSKVI